MSFSRIRARQNLRTDHHPEAEAEGDLGTTCGTGGDPKHPTIRYLSSILKQSVTTLSLVWRSLLLRCRDGV